MAQTFEELEIWKLSRELTKLLGNIFYKYSFKNYSFQDQIMRAAISVSNNIAEWRERSTNKSFNQFLSFAKWFVGEVRSMLYTALDMWYINDIQFKHFYVLCVELSVKIYKFMKSIS